MKKCKVRIIKELEGVYPEYQPKVGKTYDAEYREPYYNNQWFTEICIIEISGKRIIVREGEFEIVRCNNAE